MINFRERLNEDLQQSEARLNTILDLYFPEFRDILKSIKGKAAMAALDNFPFPADLIEKPVGEVPL
ncbi:hypothetical protein [Desulfofundulus sp.]|uniref:hypothetical protein n=1 Tax=Desulfofundulus sp. TaxID=2282750 RepID=UPI003C77CBDE